MDFLATLRTLLHYKNRIELEAFYMKSQILLGKVETNDTLKVKYENKSKTESINSFSNEAK
jgi:hypothetical protein